MVLFSVEEENTHGYFPQLKQLTILSGEREALPWTSFNKVIPDHHLGTNLFTVYLLGTFNNSLELNCILTSYSSWSLFPITDPDLIRKALENISNSTFSFSV